MKIKIFYLISNTIVENIEKFFDGGFNFQLYSE